MSILPLGFVIKETLKSLKILADYAALDADPALAKARLSILSSALDNKINEIEKFSGITLEECK